MYQLQQQPQIKKRKSPVRQEKVVARKQTAQPVPVQMDIPEMLQFKKYTETEIIKMAAEQELGFDLNSYQSFIRLLAGIEVPDERWFSRIWRFFWKTEKKKNQVEMLLWLAKENGESVPQLLEYMETHPLAARDQQGSFGSDPNGRLTEEALLSMMNGEQIAVWMQQLQILLPISGEEGTKKAVEAALLYVNTGYVNSDMGNQLQCFIQSLQSITAFIRTAYQGMEEEDREGYWLVSTGSDRHMGGRHVLFLINKHNSNDRKVYKPRSVAIDNALIGKEGIFHMINSYDPSQADILALATMQINERSGRDNQPYGIEEYKTKKGTFEAKAAEKYYFQMGVLAVASRYVGLSDLHQDNIMPTEAGPLVIDAEVGLFFENDELRDALNQEENQLSQPAMANITITGEGPHEFSWEETNIFNQQYEAGKQAMEGKMAYLVRQPEFVQIFFKKTKNLRTRIVPVPTNVLAAWYRICVENHFNREKFCSEQSINEDILSRLRNDIQDKNFNPYFQRKDKEAIFPDPEIIPHLIFNAFCRHDVPLFELQLKNGEQAIYLLEGIPIGHTAVEFRYRNVLGG